ncbi:MAG: hypothetical protein ACYTGA_06460, partial [Planctomycetota bacterium]
HVSSGASLISVRYSLIVASKAIGITPVVHSVLFYCNRPIFIGLTGRAAFKQHALLSVSTIEHPRLTLQAIYTTIIYASFSGL